MQVANVPEILFKPVYFRAKETQRADGIIQDPIAVEILQKISPNLSGIDDWTIQFGIVIHTTIVDNVVKQFLQQQIYFIQYPIFSFQSDSWWAFSLGH